MTDLKQKTFCISLINSNLLLESKKAIATVVLAIVSFTCCMQFETIDFAYGQFFDNSDTTETNSSGFSMNSTQLDDSHAPEIVLLSQKLKKASFGYRDLVGQVKNIGNDTAEFVKIVVDTFDKNGNIIGTDYVYATATTLKANQRSSFELSSDSQNFKGMDHYEISLQWNNPDGTEGYVENAQIYKSNHSDTTE
jgi:hypothetical protein